MQPWMQYLAAVVVMCHGLVYILVGAVLPGPVKEWAGKSWLLGDALQDPELTTLVVALHVIAGLAMVICAIAIGAPSLLPGWWRPLAMVAAALGMLAFSVFWDGQTGRMLLDEGLLGAAISAILFIVAMTRPGGVAFGLR